MTEALHERIVVVDRWPGYAHIKLQGTCDTDVTVDEIKKRFYHSYFGGREAWVKDGRWGCVVHTD